MKKKKTRCVKEYKTLLASRIFRTWPDFIVFEKLFAISVAGLLRYIGRDTYARRERSRDKYYL